MKRFFSKLGQTFSTILKIVVLLFICVFIVEKISEAEEKAKSSPIDSLKMVSGDEKGNEVKALKTEMLITSAENRAIKQINRLLKKHRGTELEGDLWFRLAELHMRRARSERFFELNRKSSTLVSLAPRYIKKASSRREIKKAIGIYEKIQRRFKKFSQLDLVLFNNAFARQNLGQTKMAEKRYFDLIKRFPNSILVPDSHLAIGEINFDRKKFKHALDHFNAIKSYPNSRVYPYGLYKAGWAYYNLRQAKKGIKELEKVVAYGVMVAANGIDSRLDLRKEALADMTLFFEDIYKSEDAFDYFTQQCGELDASPVLLKLANLYKIHSRYKDVQTLLEDFRSNLEYSVFLPDVHNELVINYENMKNRKGAVVELKRFEKICHHDSRWAKNTAPLDANRLALNIEIPQSKPVENCVKTLNGTSLNLASKWLRLWRKNKSYPEFADVSEEAFKIFLRSAPDTEDSYKSRFAFAELLFQRKKYRLASAQYEKVSLKTKGKTLLHDSSYSALLSLEKAVKDKWSDDDELKFLVLAKHYAVNNPKGKFILDVDFKRAMIAYEKERFAEAGPIFKKLGNQFSKTEKGLKAQDLYLDILNLNKDYASLKDYSQGLIKSGGNSKRIDKLTKIYEQSYFLQVQDLEEKSKLDEAIKGYKSFAKSNPKSELAEKAWWNATLLHLKVYEYEQCASSAMNFYKKYPQSKHAKEALLKAAQIYEEMGQLKKAANVIERLISKDKEQKSKWISLASDFYRVSGDYSKSRKSYWMSIKSSQDDQQKYEQLVKLWEMEKSLGNPIEIKRVESQLMSMKRNPVYAQLQLKELESVYASKNYPKSFELARKLVGQKSAPTNVRARARFIQAQILGDEFSRQSVKTKVERITLVLQIKTEKLEKAQKAYQSTIKIGDPYLSVESLVELSEIYSKYATDLKNMPLPRGMTPSDESVFRAEIQKLVIPMEEKSVESMIEAINQAVKLKLRNGIIAQLKKRLNKLNFKKEELTLVRVKQPKLVVPTGGGS